jgi:23S rRNA G2445 N2-methylase RlmL
MFATCVPGLAPLVRRELGQAPGLRATDSGFDGRADVVLVDAARGHRDSVLSLRTVEDVFIEVGRAGGADSDNPRRIAGVLWRPEPVQRALSIWAEHNRPLTGTMTFRVVTRVLSEQTFRRTELRQRLTEQVSQDRRRWKAADPAQVEIWACEYRPGRIVAGLRISDARLRQHGGRSIERPGALRPTLAAAMVNLAGKPSGVLLDPCCGTGTILAEATAAGWMAAGSDIDPAAAEIARVNVPRATVKVGDALKMRTADASVGACVTNLPFGRQYRIRGEMRQWLGGALREITRVIMPGGSAVLLAPAIPAEIVPPSLAPAGTFPVRLLGLDTAIWCYQRPGVRAA